jgi:hypothetical protein
MESKDEEKREAGLGLNKVLNDEWYDHSYDDPS